MLYEVITEDLLRDAFGVEGTGDVLDQDRELVAAQARHGVAGAHALRKRLADGFEHFVAALVAQAVVYDLEAVEVQEQDGEEVVGIAPGGA